MPKVMKTMSGSLHQQRIRDYDRSRGELWTPKTRPLPTTPLQSTKSKPCATAT
jgi:hypothetical protein